MDDTQNGAVDDSEDAAPGAAWHARDAEEVAEDLAVDTDRGLSGDEAARRLEQHGPNQLAAHQGPQPLRILLGQFRSPLVAILLVAGVVALGLGELIDAAFIAVVLVVNTVLGFVQELRAASSIEALMELASPHATVLRDGEERQIDATEVVPGDMVVLSGGDRIPADLRLIDVDGLEVDESLLTGESSVARKQPDTLEEDTDLGDRDNRTFLGTTVAAGRGRGVVVATGMDSELGAIAQSVQSEQEPTTPLQRRLERFSRLIALAVLATAAVTFGIGLLVGVPADEVLLFAVTLAVAAVPEGLPIAFTVALALGVRGMARRGAVIRQLPAVETLGSTTVICTDKTGTLTRNHMTVERVWAAGRVWQLDEERGELVGDDDGPADAFEATLRGAVLTNEATWEGPDTEPEGDPTEVALLWSAQRGGVDPQQVRDEEPELTSRPFDPSVLRSLAVRDGTEGPVMYVKGATEPLLDRCRAACGPDGEEVDLDPDAVLEAVEEMAQEGLRVLAVAARRLDAAPQGDDDLDPDGLVLLGVQGMMDPPREGVAEAIADCRQAGIRVVMVTGDHGATARAIADELSLTEGEARVLGGQQVADLDDDELRDRVGDVDVFSRMTPDHKLRVVHALQERGEVVTVTGDGVNDAPALKAAEIGVAMGDSGTDVAREASEMVLTDDDFVSIRYAVEEGRRTFDVVRQVTFFLVATGAGAVLSLVGGLALGLGLVLLPAQILWLNVVTNGFQDVALAFERSDADRLHRPPHRIDEGLLSRRLWERVVVIAVVMATVTLVLYAPAFAADEPTRARSIALTALVLTSAVLVYSARSEHVPVWRVPVSANPFLLVAQIGAVVVHAAALQFGPLAAVLRVEPIGAGTWATIVGGALVALVASEAHKWLRRPRQDAAGDGSTPLRSRSTDRPPQEAP